MEKRELDDKLVADFKADNISRKNYNSYEVEYTSVPVKKIKIYFFDKDKSKTSITKEEREKMTRIWKSLTSENGLYIYSTIEGTMEEQRKVIIIEHFLAMIQMHGM